MKKILLLLVLVLPSVHIVASDYPSEYAVKPEVLNIRDAPNGAVIGKGKKNQIRPAGYFCYVNYLLNSRIVVR
jgi:hypothetical protein